MSLKQALEELLVDWRADLSSDWRLILHDTELAFDAVDTRLELHPWEPIFPSRRGFTLPGEPPGTHLLRAGMMGKWVQCHTQKRRLSRAPEGSCCLKSRNKIIVRLVFTEN